MTQFTVVVTVYQRDDFVPRVLHCLASQTHTDWNAIVISDGPHPLAKRAVNEFSGPTGARVRFQESRRAPGMWGNPARRSGLAQASGDYVCFIGHDCLLNDGYLAAHAENIEQASRCLSVVQTRYWRKFDFMTKRTEPIEKYVGVLPGLATNPQTFQLGQIDLTGLAFPVLAGREIGIFRPAWDAIYIADWLAFAECRKVMPVILSPKVVCAHF